MLGIFAIENSWFSDTYWTCKIGRKIGGIPKMIEFINSKKKKKTATCMEHLWSYLP